MPNPTTGFLVFAPSEDLTEIDMSIEDGIKYVVSGGIVDTEKLKLIDVKDIKVEPP